MVYRHNAWARRFVQNVSRGMKQRKKIAIVALARKLLVQLWAMLRDGTGWRDPDQPREPHKGEDGGVPPAGVLLPSGRHLPKTAVSSVGLVMA